MPEREVAAYVIGKRYDCDECGEEMARHGATAALSNPPQYPHRCPNGHAAAMTRSYPGYDVLITQEPVPKHVRRQQPTTHPARADQGAGTSEEGEA